MTVKAGDKLEATLECPACGGQAKMSVTKNMTVFAYCKEVIDKETGEKCGYRGFLGRRKSREIIREYNQHIGEKENVLQDETGPAGDNRNPAEPTNDIGPSPAGPPRGIIGAAKHFFTADE